MKKILTLCFIYQHPKVLLGMKKRGFGAGRWNGFGGKVKEGETIEEAVKRETQEEVSIVPENIEKFGIINFEFQGSPEILEVHFFKVNKFSGQPKESEEMKPKWFNLKEVPFQEMWPDDKLWFPIFLRGKKFKGKFLFENENKILKYTLKEVNLV